MTTDNTELDIDHFGEDHLEGVEITPPTADNVIEGDDDEIVTDGGEDYADLATDDQIRRAIMDRGTEEMTIEGVRDALAAVERDLADYIEEFDEGDELVAETADACIYADPDGVELDESMSGAGIDDAPMRAVLGVLMYDLAECRCAYDWSAVWPVVIRKPAAHRRGVAHVERTIEGFLDRGMSPTEALDYYMCSIRQWSQIQWADQRGVTRGAVHQNVQQAQSVMREQY